MRLNNYFITVLVIIFFILPFKNSYSKDFIVSDAIDPYCDGIDVDAFLLEKKVSNIEIKPDNPRRWLRNAFRAIVEFNSDEYKTDDSQWFTFRISNNFKKNFNSDLFVNLVLLNCVVINKYSKYLNWLQQFIIHLPSTISAFTHKGNMICNK